MASLLALRRVRRWFVPAASTSLLVVAAACGGSDGTDLFGGGAGPQGSGVGGTANGDGGGSSSGGQTSGGVVGGGSVVDTGAPPPADAGVDAPTAVTCVAPKANCSGIASDGCNVDTSTDNANCGGCGVTCAGGCSGGVCPLVQTPSGTPPAVGDFACIAVDATNVYVATGRAAPNGSVYKVPTAGGAPSVIASNLASPHGITSDGTNIYFTTTVAAVGQIFRAPVSGGTALPIASNQPRPVDVVVANGMLFWLDAGDTTTSGSVWKSALDGSGATALETSLGLNRIGHLRANASMVFWTDNTFGVYAVAVDGGKAVPISKGQSARYLDIDATNVYFSAGAQGASATTSILRGPLAGSGAAGTPTATSLVNAMGVATDGARLYWAEAGSGANTGKIWRANNDGTNAVVIATKQNYPACIALDKTSVYWINEGGGMVSKTAK